MEDEIGTTMGDGDLGFKVRLFLAVTVAGAQRGCMLQCNMQRQE